MARVVFLHTLRGFAGYRKKTIGVLPIGLRQKVHVVFEEKTPESARDKRQKVHVNCWLIHRLARILEKTPESARGKRTNALYINDR
jgi:hypothetical protein